MQRTPLSVPKTGAAAPPKLPPPPPVHHQRFPAAVRVGIAATVLLLLLLLPPRARHNEVEEEEQWGAVIDAGSTGTRLHLFRFPRFPGPAVVERFEAKEKVLSSEVVAELLRGARLPKRPGQLFIGATAGLRKEGAATADRKLKAAKSAASEFGFRKVEATLLRGEDEGRYAWKTVSFLLGGSEGHAILDAGGGSFQVALPGFAGSVQGAGIVEGLRAAAGGDAVAFLAAHQEAAPLKGILSRFPGTLYAFSFFHKLTETLSYRDTAIATPADFVLYSERRCQSNGESEECRRLTYLSALLRFLYGGDARSMLSPMRVAKKLPVPRGADGQVAETAWPLGAYLSSF